MQIIYIKYNKVFISSSGRHPRLSDCYKCMEIYSSRRSYEIPMKSHEMVNVLLAKTI